MIKEFNFNNELKKIFEEELLGRTTNTGRIYRKLRARDEKFIRLLATLALTESQWNRVKKWVGEKII